MLARVLRQNLNKSAQISLFVSPFSSVEPKSKHDPSFANYVPKEAFAVPRGKVKVVERALAINVVEASLKFGLFMQTGSSAILSEAMHTVVDSVNQSALWFGLNQSGDLPNSRFHFGKGKSSYAFSLISAVGMFWIGTGVVVSSLQKLLHPVETTYAWYTWPFLGLTLALDSYVVGKTLYHEFKKKEGSFIEKVKAIRDPTTIQVLVEDSVAMAGVLTCMTGMLMTHNTGDPFYDNLAGLFIGGTIAGSGAVLANRNLAFLLGRAVDPVIQDGVVSILENRPSIDAVRYVQTQMVGPRQFTFKAEIDFDGTFLAARLDRQFGYVSRIENFPKSDRSTLISFYTEDVMRALETEIKSIEKEIRASFPEAVFIELEPSASDSDIPAFRKKMLFKEKSKLSQCHDYLDETEGKLKKTPIEFASEEDGNGCYDN
eukprot:TRINITY_DN30_c0_g1_i1.p1 TRINITY_DN30_c0_g1~~TRINITY_DN30_c0_g1_i1.p1  ORF type:complete len:430 (+),score=107.70 TRINITY_DN30_c0_g1_i1:94-1383(+)